MDNRKTVLLADANEEFRTMLRESIEKEEEFTVVGSTGDGMEAFQMLEAIQPDLIIMDLVMPGLDGLSVLARMRQAEMETKAVLYSAF